MALEIGNLNTAKDEYDDSEKHTKDEQRQNSMQYLLALVQLVLMTVRLLSVNISYTLREHGRSREWRGLNNGR